MKARDVVGRKIIRIQQTRVIDNSFRSRVIVERLVLDNGTVLYPMPVELEDTTEATILHHRVTKGA